MAVAAAERRREVVAEPDRRTPFGPQRLALLPVQVAAAAVRVASQAALSLRGREVVTVEAGLELVREGRLMMVTTAAKASSSSPTRRIKKG
jgi:hypothetical protein